MALTLAEHKALIERDILIGQAVLVGISATMARTWPNDKLETAIRDKIKRLGVLPSG